VASVSVTPLVEPCGFGQASGLVLLLGGGEQPLGLGPRAQRMTLPVVAAVARRIVP